MLFRSEDFRSASSDFYKLFSGSPIWNSIVPTQEQSREAVFARVIGLLSLTLSRIFPAAMREEQISAYYLSAR